MAVAIIIGIIVLIIIINVSSNNRRREREEAERQARLKRQKEEAERQARLKREREEAERKKREQERIQRLQEELKYETVEVVLAWIDDSEKPSAIVKRPNNTYCDIEHSSGSAPYSLNAKVKLLKEKSEKWDWYNENEYQIQRVRTQQKITLLETKRHKEETERQARLKREREEAERKKREQEERERQAKAKLENLLVKKQNWQEFQQVLQQNGVITLYHFTDRANIASIKKYGGLYSWDYCDKNDIIIPYQGGGTLSRDLDRKYSLQDYVRVSFTRNHPMMFVAQNEGRIQNPVILTISLDVCYFQETRFANMNATKTGHKQGKNLENLQSVHFNTVKQINHFDLDELEKPYFQAEVLVKTWIPIKYITNINNF